MRKIKIFFIALVVLIGHYSQAQSPNKLKSSDRTTNKMNTTVKKSSTLNYMGTAKKNNQHLVSSSETKAIFFVHGLAGDAMSWSTPQAWTVDEYNVRSPEINYAYESSLDGAESTVREKFNKHNELMGEDYDHTKSIYIGHSMGGTVALQINYEENNSSNPNKTQEFGALATFGSPLAGAPVVNNEDCLDKLINEGCKAITHPEIAKTLRDISDGITDKIGLIPGFLTGILNDRIKTEILELAPHITKGLCSITPLAFSFLKKEILPSVGHDLDPEGDIMKTLKEHEVTIPSIAYWGSEDAPVSLREIYSLQHDVNRPDRDEDNPNPPLEKEFTADYDEGYIDVMNDLKDEMEAKSRLLKTKDRCYVGNINISSKLTRWICEKAGGTIKPSPISGTFICAFCENKEDLDLAKKYEKAAQWIRDFDKQYQLCFGLGDFKTEKKSITVCRCYMKNSGPQVKTWDVPCYKVEREIGDLDREGVLDCRDEQVIKVTQTEIKHTSDGVVPSWSSKKINVADGVYFKDYVMPGSNHQQMRNDRNAGKHFRNMFNGLYDPAFKLNR